MPARSSPEAPRIVVVGSANTDLVMRTAVLPKPGETVLGGAFSQVGGGKAPTRQWRQPAPEGV